MMNPVFHPAHPDYVSVSPYALYVVHPEQGVGCAFSGVGDLNDAVKATVMFIATVPDAILLYDGAGQHIFFWRHAQTWLPVAGTSEMFAKMYAVGEGNEEFLESVQKLELLAIEARTMWKMARNAE